MSQFFYHGGRRFVFQSCRQQASVFVLWLALAMMSVLPVVVAIPTSIGSTISWVLMKESVTSETHQLIYGWYGVQERQFG